MGQFTVRESPHRAGPAKKEMATAEQTMAKAASEITQEEAEKQIVKRFAAMREEKQKVAQKISELTQEKGEHK